MQTWLRKVKGLLNLVIFVSAVSCSAVFAEPLLPEQSLYTDRAQLAVQQIKSLENRLAQARLELDSLEKQQNKSVTPLAIDRVNKALLDKIELAITIAKSNLDSASIELTDSQQAINWLEKNVQEISNQLNALTIFGLKAKQAEVLHFNELQNEIKYQENLLLLERERFTSLQDLQNM